MTPRPRILGTRISPSPPRESSNLTPDEHPPVLGSLSYSRPQRLTRHHHSLPRPEHISEVALARPPRQDAAKIWRRKTAAGADPPSQPPREAPLDPSTPWPAQTNNAILSHRQIAASPRTSLRGGGGRSRGAPSPGIAPIFPCNTSRPWPFL